MRNAILLLVFVASGLRAQDTTRRVEHLCVVPRDGSRCRAYLITEVGVSKAFSSTTSRLVFKSAGATTRTDFGTTAHGALGISRNFGDRKAVGVAAIFDAPRGHGGFGGVELRYRDWIDTSSAALEFHLGYGRSVYETISPGGNLTVFRRFGGARGGMALQAGPYMTVFTRGEITNSGGQTHSAVFAGAGATSHASYATVGAVTLVALMFFTFFASPET